MPIERHHLSDKEVRFEISFAVGQVPRSVWVRVRGKDRIASDAAIEQVVLATTERFRSLEVVREYDPDAGDWRRLGNGRD